MKGKSVSSGSEKEKSGEQIIIDSEKKAKINETKRDVQVGYEKKEALTVLTRSVLETADLRNFHNWIKSVIIKKYSEECKL